MTQTPTPPPDPAPPPTALIADDEDAARACLVAALRAAWPGLRIVESANGVDAWDAFLEHEPAFCFLDVRMPGMTGIEVAQRIGGQAQIVFVCAATDHALQTFETGAIAHLRKPVDEAHVAEVVQFLRSRAHAVPADLADVLDRLVGRVRKPAPLDVISGGGPEDLQVLPVDHVVYFETEGRGSTRVVHKGGEMSIRTPIKDLLGVLDATQFRQVHRSVIVNQRYIAGSVRADDGSLRLALRERGETLPVARQFRGLFATP